MFFICSIKKKKESEIKKLEKKFKENLARNVGKINKMIGDSSENQKEIHSKMLSLENKTKKIQNILKKKKPKLSKSGKKAASYINNQKSRNIFFK